MRARSSLAAIVSVAIVACAGAGPSAATPAPTPWRVVALGSPASVGGKSLPGPHISIPPDWTIAASDSAWFKRVQGSFDDPDRYRLLLLAEAQAHPADPTATITTWHLDADYAVEDVASATWGNYFDQVTALMVEARSMDLGDLHVRRQELRWDTTGSGARITWWALQYFYKKGHEAYMLEFIAPFDQRGDVVDLLDAIAATLMVP